MFMQIRIWLRAVERSTGVKPILYVNQMFVNNYLSKQPDLKRDYCVWIARYSEYKPDLRLAFWQLCPDGHVAGIQGDVDINVFNGYKLQFEKFLEEETIKR
jgi:lysozyme